MPPKKKRGAQTQVTIPVVKKMSTRSRKKTEKGEALVLAKPAKAPKKPKAPAKPKVAKKPPAKKKGGKSTQPQPAEPVLEIEPEPEPEPESEPEPDSAPVPEENMTQESTSGENVFDELVLEDDTLEEKEETIETVVEDDEQMDTAELPSEATEEISQQLEALDVTESQDGSVLELENVNGEVIEYECLDYTVEYVTEDFVPVAEDTEIVIEEEEEEEEAEEEESESPNFELLESMQNVYIEKVEPKVEEEPEPVSMEPEETIDEVEAKLVELVKSEEPEPRSEAIKAAEFKSIEAELAGFEAEPVDNLVEVKQAAPLDIPVVIEPAELKSVETKPDEQKSSETKTAEAKEKPKRRRTATKKEPKKTTAKKGKSKSTPKKEELDKTEEVRRSSRIKSISVLKQRSKGHGLVKTPKPSLKTASEVVENKPPAAAATAAPALTTDEKPVDSPSSHHSHHSDFECKPVKVKSRWRLSSELEMNVLTPASVVNETQGDSEKIAEATAALLEKSPPTVQQKDEEVETRLKQFVHLKENSYLTDRMSCKEAKKMTCDCFLTPEEIERGEFGCGEDCLNRLLMIECGSLCPVGDRCTNKKFQKLQFAPVEVFKTEKKGLGLRAAANVPYGEFILEYVGEVLDHEEFGARADDYSKDQNKHYYFMSLRADAIIDATGKGNISRFINHSCDPNAETQKWTVNGELRIGFFSTRTILAGEEITFDYRFQRYGKEAQKCFCEAPTCRGWLGEEPEDEDDDDEDDEEDEEALQEEEEEEQEQEQEAVKVEIEKKVDEIGEGGEESEVKQDVLLTPVEPKPPRKPRKRVSPKRKPRKDKFEDLDQLDEEIDMVVTTGLKNQAHTLKLSRLMVRAKEPAQRTKLLRILRRGELPCRRLFLDYHGLRLMHGYMTDAQHLAKTDTKFENLRLEMLQTLATLPIPNKTMLQDSKVLPTVEKWSVPASTVNTTEMMDSDSNSPQTEDVVASQAGTVADEVKTEIEDVKQDEVVKEDVEAMEVTEAVEATADKITKEVVAETPEGASEDKTAKSSKSDDQPNYEEEIIALALKLLEEWSNLKEVFKIPKKERIEQMKEHEREANKGYIAGLGLEPQDPEKKNESRYRILKRYRSIEKVDGSGPGGARKNIKLEDRTIVNFPKLDRDERRKMFALQVEQHEEERRRKQREMWRQHEQHCFLLGTDPRLTAPYDPSRSGYQCIWNPQIGQWQNYPIQNPNIIYNPQNPSPIPGMPMNMPPPNPNFPAYLQPNLHHVQSPAGMMPPPGSINQMHPLPALPYQEEVAKKNEDYTQVKFMGPIPPAAKLPAKWKCAKDKYGRPYYYHIRVRKSQWEPPPPPPVPEELDESSETTSSSDTSSLSSETSSDEMDSDDEINDTKLLIDVRKHMEKQSKISPAKALPVHLKTEEDCETPSPVDDGGISKEEEQEEEPTSIIEPAEEGTVEPDGDGESSTIDARIKDLIKEEKVQQPLAKKRRSGLVHEIIISPRSEEDRQQFREDIKRYKQNKEKLKREKEQILQQTKKHVKEKRSKSTVKAKMKEMSDSNSKAAKNIKENFRSNMATVVVSVLNSYRKPDCKEGRITNTDDFKHLARKLTHFVMLKEMKHIEKIEDLVCTDNVKAKAREYIKKYMSKFGENYQKRNDEPDF